MRRIPLLMVAAAVACLAVATWLWWVKPRRVDMTSYAPPSALIYLETNNPLDVVKALRQTDAWRIIEVPTRKPESIWNRDWLQKFVGWTGLGPIESVILARAQVAVVITDLGTAEEGETLRIKPEGVAIIQTHTSEGRIRAPVERALKQLAEMTYERPTLKRTFIDGVEFIEWTGPTKDRQIVASISGSLVVVGNSERAVQNCLATARGRQPNLREDPELIRMRQRVDSHNALAFGYVPPANSSRLLSVGVPLLLGRSPEDSDFQRLIIANAGKMIGSIGWSARPFSSGVEDRYSISLEPSLVARLKPEFALSPTEAKLQNLLPSDVYSATVYKFKNPAEAWLGLRTAVAAQVDTLSAILFSTILKSSLVDYGVEQPEQFLDLVRGEVITIRMTPDGENAMLIAQVRDQSKMRDFLSNGMNMSSRINPSSDTQLFENSQRTMSATINGDVVAIGSPPDIKRIAEQSLASSTNSQMQRITSFVPFSSSANILTYTDDSNRVRSFLSSIMVLNGGSRPQPDQLEQAIAKLPYSATQTSLGETGFSRTTRSSLGQFSTLLSLAMPDKTSSQSNPPTVHP